MTRTELINQLNTDLVGVINGGIHLIQPNGKPNTPFIVVSKLNGGREYAFGGPQIQVDSFQINIYTTIDKPQDIDVITHAVNNSLEPLGFDKLGNDFDNFTDDGLFETVTRYERTEINV